MEIWKPVSEYEDRYEVSNYGNVRGWYSRWGKRSNPIYLKNHNDSKGYPQVQLYNGESRKIERVHRIVAKEFVDGFKCGLEVNHIDGNPENNNPNNLEWVTRSQNIIHADNNGLRNVRGEGNCHSKVTSKDVDAIRLAHNEWGWKQSLLSEVFGISNSQVSRIAKNVSWKHHS